MGTVVPRFRLTIEYAGTRYSGWQIQKNARTIQGELDRAIRTVTHRQDFELYGSGRTDAGVHAVAQVAHLDVSTGLPPESLVRDLNAELPADINVLAAEIVPHRFHARHSATARRYVYQIATRRTAFAKPYVWWIKEPLNLAAMQAAAEAFVGMKDFQSFAADDDADWDPKSTLVLIDRLEVTVHGDLLLVIIQGSHFLWKMVRRIVGVLVEVGRGDLTIAVAQSLLTAKSDLPARLTAPASGLFLERVFYQGDGIGSAVEPPTPLIAVAATSRARATRR
jgi:tRNA pseudouridine38-40 synthase